MLAVKDKGRLLQIIKHCERIELKICDISKSEFDQDIDLMEIVCFNLFQIGELAKGLSEEFISRYDKVPWKQIKGMRDRIGHGYDSINPEIDYNTAKESISELKEYCLKIAKREQ